MTGEQMARLEPTVRAYLKGINITKRYIKTEELTLICEKKYPTLFHALEKEDISSVEFIRLLALEAGALYKLSRIELIKKERFDDYMKHLYKVPGTNKQVIKKFVRIGEGSIIYGIGHHRFIEMARAAGATYKIGEGTGGTVLINLEIFDSYMEQFRQEAVPMKNPLFHSRKDRCFAAN